MCYSSYRKSNDWIADKKDLINSEINHNKLYLISDIAKILHVSANTVKRFITNQPLFRVSSNICTQKDDIRDYYLGKDIVKYFEIATDKDSMNTLLSDFFCLSDEEFKKKYKKTKQYTFVNGSSLVIKCDVEMGVPKFYIG